ncbi:NAD-dependent epimerase/dehydratase family protein [Arenibacter sp. GZD96]|uniref:NAD-dependent epimerase/dehydratase family protein n=1 Tax=Aurantibrevibacter litoralis TaxID=3106030 RepID=UPI002AFFB7DD|nr:NAD-dependent epimerase/dehydratase family protein [Arenibacter sp. GZD-96]MEA1787158.1 NAD-dependent epimerase/dehydratase family protein [Arenibacter sp. GZD-96]
MVLVTGGTGLVGAHLLLRLVANKTPVKAIIRTNSNIAAVKKVFSYYAPNYEQLIGNIQWVTADLLDIESLREAFENVTEVYHCAALISFDPKDEAKLQKINVEGTANIVNLCLAKKIQKLCYLSSVATIGKNPTTTEVTEETEWNADGANVYALSKYAAEMEVWRGAQEHLNVVILNPGIIIGPGFWHRGSGLLFKISDSAKNYFPPGGTGFVSVGDVVQLMLKLMHSECSNERYIVVAAHCIYADILQKIAHNLGKPAPTRKLKFWELELLWRLDWFWALFSKKGRKLTKDTVYALKNPTRYSNRKIQAALPFQFESVDESLAFCCGLYRKERAGDSKVKN